jgi:amino acid adenylation domain-containing protein
MIIQKFEEQVKQTPDKIAVKTETHAITYRALSQYANRIAALIHKHWQAHNKENPLENDASVGLLIEHGLDMIAAILGTLKAGMAYIPVSLDYPLKRIDYMLTNSEASVILTNTKGLPKAQTTETAENLPVINIDDAWNNDNIPLDQSLHLADGNRMAYILYTSGSTGKPKGVVQNQGNVLYYIDNWTQRFSITQTDRMTLFSSFSHDGSGQDMFGALLNGATLFPFDVRNRDSKISFIRFLVEEKISIWHSVPSLYNFFVNTLTGNEHFSDLKYILLGGEPFRGYEIEMFKKHFPHCILADVYGQTESSVDSIWTIRATDEIKKLIIGKPLSNTRIFVVDEEGEEVEPYETGEILIVCDHISPGYWRDEATSSKTFIDNPDVGRIYRTGDLGRLLPDGNIEFMGRRDFQVKVRGFRVEIGEIETALLQMEDIREAVVVAKQTDSQDTHLRAFIVADEQLNLTELRVYLSSQLPDYMIPTSFVQMEQLPLTQSNKTDRNALAMMDGETLKLNVDYIPPKTRLEEMVAGIWKEVLQLDELGVNDNFFDVGGNSFDIIKINNILQEQLKKNIPIVKMFEYPTVGTLAGYLTQDNSDAPGFGNSNKPVRQSVQVNAELNADIAVIGMAGKFPGAKNIHQFWENLKDGVESISFFSQQELAESGIVNHLVDNPNYIKAKGMLEDIECFDASFFNFTPAEAEQLDPQLRIFHECSWEALEHAGYNPYEYEGSIGVFAGSTPNHYWLAQVYNMENNSLSPFESMLLNTHFSTRLSYKLNLKGPSVFVQTACSTSLVAIHMACLSLQKGECHMALAGGVSVTLPKKSGYVYREGLVFSKDGHCKAFDENASGTVFGDGAGIVVLKSLDEAVAEGDYIHAVIKGSATNNDGIRKVGYTAPSIEGQSEVIWNAIDGSGASPESIGYIETHGTGTLLGDPIELEALNKIFYKNKKNSCALGAVKTNIGHLNAAAGVAGFIKTVQALKFRLIPPIVNFDVPNAQIDFIDGPFYVNTALSPWENNDGPLRAGVSAFGFGGTNAHIILEEAPTILREQETPLFNKSRIISLSAQSATALEMAIEKMVNHFKIHPEINIADVAYTLHVGRCDFNHRAVVVGSSAAQVMESLTSLEPANKHIIPPREELRPIIFIFPDSIKGYASFVLTLLEREPAFGESFDLCLDILAPITGTDVHEIVNSSTPQTDKKMDTEMQQPALQFIYLYSLAKLFMHWGINPHTYSGEGIGEYVAACLAGQITLEDSLKEVALMGKFVKPRTSDKSLQERDRLNKMKNALLVHFGSPLHDSIDNNNGQVPIALTQLAQAHDKVDYDSLLSVMAHLWKYGIKPNWQAFYGEEKRNRIPLPTYSFDRKRYWLPDRNQGLLIDKQRQLASGQNDKNQVNVHVPSWQPSFLSSTGRNSTSNPHKWIVFANEIAIGDHLIQRLTQDENPVVVVNPGPGFSKDVSSANPIYTINPTRPSDYELLIKDLLNSRQEAFSIAHLWGVTGIDHLEGNPEPLSHALDMGLYSLIYLAKSIDAHRLAKETPVNIHLITDYMQRVPGQEDLCPEKAPLLSAVSTIPREFPNIRCHAIDIVLPSPGSWQETRLLGQLLTQLESLSPDPQVAIRGTERLVPGFQPIPTVSGDNPALSGNQNPVYLMAGELKSATLNIADYLARTCQPTFIYLDETPKNSSTNWKIDHAALQKTEKRLATEFAIKAIDTYPHLEKTVNDLCAGFVLNYFKENAIQVEEGKTYDRKQLKEQLRIMPKFDKFFDTFIRILSEDKLIKVAGETIEFLKAAAETGDPLTWIAEAQEQFPQLKGTMELVKYCSKHYSPAISGEIEAISVLYPGGEYIKFNQSYQDKVEYSNTRLYTSLLKAFILQAAENRTHDAPLRILEIGGGKGLLTDTLVVDLKDRNVHYHFTDVGNFFVVNARKEAERRGFQFMKFDVFDITKSPEEQGFENYSYDLILGMNVVHAVDWIEKTLGNLKQLLVPGGNLCLVELTNPKRWLNMIDGLAEGWWYYQDNDIRMNSSLLSLENWERAFRNQDFDDVHCYPHQKERQEQTDCGLIIARQPLDITIKESRFKNIPEGLRQLEKYGASVHGKEIEFANTENFTRTMQWIQEKWGPVNGVLFDMHQVIKNELLSKTSPQCINPEFLQDKTDIMQLREFLSSASLDFFLLISTAATARDAFSNPVQLFLDAFADYNMLRNNSIKSIQWAANTEISGDDLFPLMLYGEFSRLVVADQTFFAEEATVAVESKQDDQFSGYQRPDLSTTYIAPRNPVEETIVKVWQEFLGIENIGIKDDFLELGADSLVFITIATKLHKALDVKVPVAEFFIYPNVKELSHYISGTQRNHYTAIEPADKKDHYPLSPAQRRIYLLYMMDPGSISYNVPLSLKVQGKIDNFKFEETLKKLIQRHESLRTSFTLIDDSPVQIIHQDVNFQIQYASAAPDASDIEISTLIKSFIRPFNLSQAPLMRFILIKLEQEKHILLVDMQHIISDGISLNIFVKDFIALFSDGQLPALKLQYKDYAQWWHDFNEGGGHRQLEDFWLDQFPYADQLQVLELPTDFPRPDIQSFAGGRLTFDITGAQSLQLKSLAAEQGTTLFMVLLAVFYVFLAKLTNQETIIIGTVAAGRKHAELDPIIGIFINTIALINRMEGNLPFDRFIENVSKRTFDAFENQDYPFDNLLEKLGVTRDPARNPLFDVMFVMENFEKSDVRLPGLTFDRYAYENPTAQVDLTLAVFETEENLHFSFEYCRKIFKKDTVQMFADQVKKIISTVLNNTDIPLENITIDHGYTELETRMFETDVDDFEDMFAMEEGENK